MVSVVVVEGREGRSKLTGLQFHDLVRALDASCIGERNYFFLSGGRKVNHRHQKIYVLFLWQMQRNTIQPFLCG